jgi:hypothetical protein
VVFVDADVSSSVSKGHFGVGSKCSIRGDNLLAIERSYETSFISSESVSDIASFRPAPED